MSDCQHWIEANRRLHQQLAEAAVSLGGLADYLDREADAAAGTFRERDLRQEAANCREIAARLRGET